MTDTDDRDPFGRGFIAACIVIAALVLCGAILLIADLTGPAPASPVPLTGQSPLDVATTPASTTLPAASPAEPAPSHPAAGCALPAGDQSVPTTRAPAVDGWEVSRRVVVPRSASYGPATVEADGFRRCFAHSPGGALYAAYNVIAALADAQRASSTVTKLMLPGPDTDALLQELRAESGSTGSEPAQLAGYRLIDASRDCVSLTLALRVESEFAGLTLTLVWHSGDWRVVPPSAGRPVGAPYSQHRDLDGFVAWSGV